MEDQVTLTVDGQEMRAPKGTLLWEACKAHGIDIPIFCYHTKLGPVGACRTCLVEQAGVTKGPITACSTPVADGMVIRTRSPVVEKAQRGIFEFLLANHPLDCPICDRGGECPLQDQTYSYGPGTSRYVEPKRHHVKPIPIGPTIALDRERCVLCWRCVRFCAEIAEDKSIILLDRGDHTVVGTFQDEPYVSNFSGNVVELCPVGALTSRKQRFTFRPWELKNRPSICPHCPMGCNINVSVRKNDEVIRFLSRDNPQVDDSWLCDRGRYNFEFINDPNRLTAPLIRRGEAFQQVPWPEAMEFIAGRLHDIMEENGPNVIAGIASPRLTNEDLFVFKRFITDVLGSPHVDHYPRPQVALTPPQLDALDHLDRRLMPIAALEKAKTILLLGANPSEREPVLELRIRKAVNKSGARLVVLHPDDIPLGAKADVVLRYPRERFAGFARSLRDAIAAGRSTSPGQKPSSSGASPQLSDLVSSYLCEGPIAVLYDDTFEGIEDKGGALEALAAVVDELSTGVETGVIPMLDDCNSMGARDLNILPPGPGSDTWGAPVISDLLSGGRIKAAFILGSNIARDFADLDIAARLEALDLLVVHELMMTETARYADVVLPAASFAEKDGTFTNTERRVQALNTAVPSPGMARADWQSLVDISQYFQAPLEYAEARDVWDDIRRAVPKYAGITYLDLSAQGSRPEALQLA